MNMPMPIPSPTKHALVGFVAALFFALVLPLALRGGLGFLGYDTLTQWFPGVMENPAGAIIIELLLYAALSAIVFAVYALTPACKGQTRAAAGWFFLGNLAGYCVFALIVLFALSAWHGPLI